MYTLNIYTLCIHYNVYIIYIIMYTLNIHTYIYIYIYIYNVYVILHKHNINETDCISHSTNTLGKGMNPIILPPVMGK